MISAQLSPTGSGLMEDIFYSVKNFQRGKNAETGKEPLRSYLSNYFCTNIPDTDSGLTEDLFYSVKNFQKMLKQEKRETSSVSREEPTHIQTYVDEPATSHTLQFYSGSPHTHPPLPYCNRGI